MKKHTAALDVGGTKIKFGIVDTDGIVISDAEIPSATDDESPDLKCDRMVRVLKEMCAGNCIVFEELRGIAVASAGPVDVEAGTIINPYSLPGWLNYNIIEALETRSGLKVRLDNDANGALMGEVFLSGTADKKVLMVTIGTGIGAAFWDGTGLYRSGRYHPEMGHVIVSSEGPECYCHHRGCFESLCSGTAMNARAKANGYGNFDGLYEAAGHNERAKALLDKIGREFCAGIFDLAIIFKPDIIMLSGGMMRRYFDFFGGLVQKDMVGLEDFVDTLTVQPTSDNKNTALLCANMMFTD